MWEDDLIPLDMILIGTTGSGKSASGNSILQRKSFTAHSSCMPVTEKVKCEWAEHSGYRIKIVDTPGIFYTEMTKEEIDEETAFNNMSMAIGMCPHGVHAFLLVINPTERGTRENLQTIRILKAIFNEDAVKNHCVVVLSRGEGIDIELEDSGLTFKEWCKQRDGYMGELFKECSYRCVRFYNQGNKYESERRESIQQLLLMVVKMTTTNGFYTHEHFQKAKDVREKMIIEKRAPQISEEIQMRMSLLSAQVEKCSEDPSEFLFEQLLQSSQQISDDIDQLVAKCEVFQKLQPRIRSIQKNVDKMIQTFENKKQGLISDEEYQVEINMIQKDITATRTPEKPSTSGEFFSNCAKTIGVVGATAVAGVVAAPALATTAVADAALEETVGGTGVIGAEFSMWEDDLIPLDLILIGKTGTGKSASGNAILKRNVFKASSDLHSVTSDVRSDWAEHSDYRIKVVDTPGIFDTDKTEQKMDKATAAENMSKAIGMCHYGVHAFLLVINSTERGTKENKETIEVLKAIFNEDAVKNHCVIAFTRGDQLDMELDESGLTFEKWCKQAGGFMGQLFKECGYRCVRFYNKGLQYESQREQSVEKLLSMVGKMIATTGLYTHKRFKEAADLREKMIIEERAPQISEEIQMKMSLLSAQVEKCSEAPSEILFEQLLQRTQQISNDIDELAERCEVFQKLQPKIRSIQEDVDNVMQTFEDKQEGLISDEEYQEELESGIKTIQEDITATRTPENPSTWGNFLSNCARTIGGVAVVGAAATAGVVAAPALAATAATGAALGAAVGGAGVIGGGLASIASKMKRS